MISMRRRPGGTGAALQCLLNALAGELATRQAHRKETQRHAPKTRVIRGYAPPPSEKPVYDQSTLAEDKSSEVAAVLVCAARSIALAKPGAGSLVPGASPSSRAADGRNCKSVFCTETGGNSG